MRVLLTGATGTLGSAVRQRLDERGDHVTMIGRSKPSGGGRFVPLDLTSEAASEELRHQLSNIDAVVHAAGVVPDDRNNRGAMESAVTMARTVADAAAGSGVRVVHLGSTSVYGNTKASGARETSPHKPANAYGEAQVRIETIFSALGSANCTARVSAVFGKSDGGSIHRLAMTLADHRWFPLPLPAVHKSIISIDDLGSAICAILDSRLSGVVNVAGGTLDLGGIVSALCRGLGRQPRFMPTSAVAMRLVGRASERSPFVSRFGSRLATLSQHATVSAEWLTTATGWERRAPLSDQLELFGSTLGAKKSTGARAPRP